MIIDKIDSFNNRYNFLSNFYYSPFMFNDRWYNTNEHFYQSHKAINNKYHEKIRNCTYPGQTKKLGNKIDIRPDWNFIKIYVMKIGLVSKFTQNIDIQKKLLYTNEIHLEEGNYWHDNFWGNCYCKKCNNKEGENVLGNMLMYYRRVWMLDKWDKDQAFDVLDAIKMIGVYPTMLSAVDFIMNDFNISRQEAKQVLYEWIQRRKNNAM